MSVVVVSTESCGMILSRNSARGEKGLLYHFPKQSGCMREKDWCCRVRAGKIALGGLRSKLAATLVIFAQAVVIEINFVE